MNENERICQDMNLPPWVGKLAEDLRNGKYSRTQFCTRTLDKMRVDIRLDDLFYQEHLKRLKIMHFSQEWDDFFDKFSLE